MYQYNEMATEMTSTFIDVFSFSKESLGQEWALALNITTHANPCANTIHSNCVFPFKKIINII